MRWAGFLGDKLFHLLSAGFGLLFAAALLSVLRVHPAAIALLCLVLALCAFCPLALEAGRKLAWYRTSLARLEALDEKYLFAELLEEASFLEGRVLRDVVRDMSAVMTGRVADARRDMTEYREYIESWVHEVKTPIASARLLLENRPGPLSAPLEEELFRIDGYVEQALFYARSGAVDRDYLIRAVPLRRLAAHALKKHARPLIATGFQIDLGALDATVYSDPKWVEFILGQILSNSLKYPGPAPRLTFSQQIGRDYVALTVRDNGPGIPAEDLPRIFDKGFTGRNGRNLTSRATGLGLYLSKKLCGRLGLGLFLSCPPDGGTEARLVFPKGRFHLAS